MPRIPRIPFLLVMSIAALAVNVRSAAPQAADPVIENVRAFAKLYGYVRWFHPSDEASAIDWDRFAIYGVGRVKAARNRDELHRELEALFLPIAPTLQIYPTEQSSPAPSPDLFPADTTGLELVAWQHKGVLLSRGHPEYRSLRLNRTTVLREFGFGTFSQAMDATPYRGKQVKLIAMARAEASELYRPIDYFTWQHVQLWLRVEGPAGILGFSDIPITASEWARYEVVSPVAENATKIVFGASHNGDSGWFDQFQLLAGDEAGNWTPVPFENPSFEAGDPGTAPPGWEHAGSWSGFATVDGSAHEGEKAAAITPIRSDTTITEPLFEQRPRAGELLNKPIGAGLSVQMPIALYSRNRHTIGSHEQEAFEGLVLALESIDLRTITARDEDVRLADVVMAWNVFEHFYPYFDVVDTDWDAVLSSTLADARVDADAREFLRTIQKMVAQLDDGHGKVSHPVEHDQARPLFRAAWVERRVVVVATADESRFRIGDVVVSVNGVPAEQILEDVEPYISGSPQWKRDVALRRHFAEGVRGTEVRVELERGAERSEVIARRSLNRGESSLATGYVTAALSEPRPKNVEEIQDGIWYVNLGRARAAEIRERLDVLAAARGVIFDVRETGNHPFVLAHLTDTALQSALWQTPQIIYPDRENLVGYDTTGRWVIEPQAPRFTGKVVFLISSRAISGSESFMGMVEHYKLGEIVGQPTAGANGNNNPFSLPGGYVIGWTGMRVIKHDGSQHHMIGIQPTVPLERTLQAVREGRDEYIERAVELILREP